MTGKAEYFPFCQEIVGSFRVTTAGLLRKIGVKFKRIGGF
jgi:hypothetical protein